ncbi:DNAJ family-like protein [Angomonas deanei]|uniref:DnaJ domain containing protein, putative n=1 Tax=Angomonas deanei TaxID=59799 RepID=S9UZ86_9TRYP|nr:DnaJ like protein subfamily C member 17 [Angomonas deanei]EPY34054.1 DNAJ family-like protein [Angomonas deanei]CAD2221448.1 DnaJ domain containing protein, putative [Angomonas deanei]|eukprot:EPY26608.1 DnaJ like protein subfamily C member 17 [Angomonas deanei]
MTSVHITVENIQQFNFYQLFNLPCQKELVDTLSIDRDAVQKVYRRLSLRFHPDKDDSEAAKVAFAYVQAARDTILDETKRLQYNKEVLFPVDGVNSEAHMERQKRAEREAKMAESVLQQREQFNLEKTRRQREEKEREEASRELLERELTSSLKTPFRLLEKELILDWNIDADLLEMKFAEVRKLLQQLAPNDSHHKMGFLDALGKHERAPSLTEDIREKRTRL